MWQSQWNIWKSRVKPAGKDRGTRRRSPVAKRKPFIGNATCFCTKRCWCARANSISRMSSSKRATRLSHERKIVSYSSCLGSRIVHSVLFFFFFIGCLACGPVCDKIYRSPVSRLRVNLRSRGPRIRRERIVRAGQDSTARTQRQSRLPKFLPTSGDGQEDPGPGRNLQRAQRDGARVQVTNLQQ